VISFALNPDALLSEAPAFAQTPKVQLVQHRRTLKAYMIRMFTCMLVSFGLAITLLLILAYTRR
jgi:hypothetical protein